MRLEGWHIIVVLGLLVVVSVIVGLVLLGSAARRGPGPRGGRQAPGEPAGRHQGAADGPWSKEDRLREIDDLYARGVISENEHQVTRKRILED